MIAESLVRGAGSIMVAVAIAGCSAADMPAGESPGVVTEVLSVAPDAPGYAVTIRITNADSGEIGYMRGCPGRLQVRRGVVWRNVGDSAGICRTSLHGLGRGRADTLTFRHEPIDRGNAVRFILDWIWVNPGDRSIPRTSTSRPARGQ